jgi:hypothetical protein
MYAATLERFQQLAAMLQISGVANKKAQFAPEESFWFSNKHWAS